MNSETLLGIIVLLVPGVSYVFYLTGLKGSIALGAALNVALALLMYFGSTSSGIFYIDFSTWIFLVMVTSVHFLSVVYSGKYFKSKSLGISGRIFDLLMTLFTTSMIFSLVINNYGLMWVGIEATTISSALLLMAEKSDASLEATWRYLVIVSAGVAFAFFSVILIYYSLGTLTVSTILSGGPRTSPLLGLAVAIALMGFGTKIGVFPVHTWLPDAHSEAPPPVSAMFSGVLLPTALYVLFRVYQIEPLTMLYVWAGVLSISAASIFLGYQTRYKRMFAYSTMENMNLALIGFAVGGTAGVTGALLLLLSHSFGKAGAFYSSGSIFNSSGAKKVDEIGGLWHSMPRTSYSLLLSSLAVTGAPPFGTFFGEFLIFYALISLHYYTALGVVLFFVVTAFIAVNHNVTKMLFGGKSELKEAVGTIQAVSIASAILPLIAGIVFVVIYLEAL